MLTEESDIWKWYNLLNSQQLESVTWHRDGTQFMSAHADGSYIVWSANDSTKPKEQPNTPYGNYFNLLLKKCKSSQQIEKQALKE